MKRFHRTKFKSWTGCRETFNFKGWLKLLLWCHDHDEYLEALTTEEMPGI